MENLPKNKPFPAKDIFADKYSSQDLNDTDWELIEQELTQLSRDCEAHILQEWEESQKENH